MNSKIIFNSSPIINLSKIDKLDLIEKLFVNIFIPYAVYLELNEKKDFPELNNLIEKKIIMVRKVKNYNLVKALQKDLDYGESEVIALALELKANLVVLDETDARNIADIYNLNKTGFIGILLKANKNGFINNFKELLDKAISKGFWINKNLYKQIIASYNH